MTVHTFRYFHRTCQPKFFDTELPTWQQLRRCHIQVGVHTLSCTVSLPDPLLPTCSGKGATTIPPLAHDDRACSSSEPKEIHFGTLKVLGLYVRSTSVAYMPIRTPPPEHHRTHTEPIYRRIRTDTPAFMLTDMLPAKSPLSSTLSRKVVACPKS